MEKTDEKGERIAKVIARSGVCSRRDAEKLVESGQVTLNGTRVTSPALNVSTTDVICVNGKPLEARIAPRLWRYHKPAGLITSHRDEAGRPTVFDSLPKNMKRVISVGRLDLNTEGLLLLTNDGALARYMELPATGWKRCYRVRMYPEPEPKALAELKNGVTVDDITYGSVDVVVEASESRNKWAMVTITEGKNREIRKVFDHIGCKVSRLIRVSYGPFELGPLAPGATEEIPTPKVEKLLRLL